jgi:hypothetical protein
MLLCQDILSIIIPYCGPKICLTSLHVSKLLHNLIWKFNYLNYINSNTLLNIINNYTETFDRSWPEPHLINNYLRVEFYNSLDHKIITPKLYAHMNHSCEPSGRTLIKALTLKHAIYKYLCSEDKFNKYTYFEYPFTSVLNDLSWPKYYDHKINFIENIVLYYSDPETKQLYYDSKSWEEIYDVNQIRHGFDRTID